MSIATRFPAGSRVVVHDPDHFAVWINFDEDDWPIEAEGVVIAHIVCGDDHIVLVACDDGRRLAVPPLLLG